MLRIFSSIESLNQCNLPFPYRIILRTCPSFEPASSALGKDGHMRSQSFLDKIRFRTTFILSFFPCNAYFWQRSWLFENFRTGYVWNFLSFCTQYSGWSYPGVRGSLPIMRPFLPDPLVCSMKERWVTPVIPGEEQCFKWFEEIL